MEDNRLRNTFKYRGYDVSVEYDSESNSKLTFSIPDRSLPNSAFGFAYFDDLDRFISCGLDWDKFSGKA